MTKSARCDVRVMTAADTPPRTTHPRAGGRAGGGGWGCKKTRKTIIPAPCPNAVFVRRSRQRQAEEQTTEVSPVFDGESAASAKIDYQQADPD
jgi:hypothetical protein